MMTYKVRLANSLILIFLTGCSSLAPLLSTPTPVPVVESTVTPQPIPTSTIPAESTSTTLRVWLPPQFDPANGTVSAELLTQRLKDFEADHSDLEIEIRIKGGNTDIVEFLSVTNSAAPTTMPDLVALSYDELQSAASAGFLHPLGGLTNLLQDPDWYAFARELGTVQNAGYGIPFAADAMMTVYRSSVFELPPTDWESIVNSGSHILFPASDSQHYFPLALYLSLNGRFANEQGSFALDEDVFVQVLSLFQSAYESGALPLDIRDFQTDVQSLNSYSNGEADLAVVWASSDIGVNSGSYTALLGLNDAPFTIGDGWTWALAGSNAENQPLTVELASYLVESEYMSEWSYVSGYLPTRPLALNGWADEASKEGLDDVLLASHPIPSPEKVSMFGPIMQEALIRIFNGEQAEIVAGSVVESLK